MSTLHYDATLPHDEQHAAAERIFKGQKVRLLAGTEVDGGSAFTPTSRRLKRAQTVRVSGISFGSEGLFLSFGRGEGRWWVSAADVSHVVRPAPWPLRPSPLAA